MKLYNSATRELEEFVPLKKGVVKMYTCGPTVYSYDHIGHGRKYTYDDVLRRLLTYNGNKVTHVQNITDVGHLISDADEGEDKMEKGATIMKKTVWEVADIYTKAHWASMDKLNILRPDISCRATEHVTEQIDLIRRLVERGFAYDTPEAVYFEVKKFPRYGGIFGQNLDEKLVGVREDVITGKHKRNSADFAMWIKTVGDKVNHVMRWESPWGMGFPGWHIECSAMSMKYLGDSFDIHTGGLDAMLIHHPNEIAQSEAATGKPMAKYWVHYGFLTVDGVKMSKSLNNFYRVEDVEEKGFNPMALRYLYLTSHYRSPHNFTWSSIAGAQTAYDKLREFVKKCSLLSAQGRTTLSKDKLKKIDLFRNRFLESVNNDLNFPMGLAVVWEMVKSNIPDMDKLELLLDWDSILGLGLADVQTIGEIPEIIKQMVIIRENLRKEGKFVEADELRMEIEQKGYQIKDTANGTVISH